VLKLLICAALLISQQALAITTADVLPKGVRATGVVHVRSDEIKSTTNTSGQLEPIAKPLNLSLGMQEFAAAEPKLRKLQDVLNALGTDQMGDKLLLANLYTEVKIQETRTVFPFFWGLTDKLMVGLTIPYIVRKVSASYRSDMSNLSSQISSAVGAIPQVGEGLIQLKKLQLNSAKLDSMIFTSNGYEMPHDFEAKGMGDIEFESRYRYYKSNPLDLAARLSIRTPTASYKPSLNNLADSELGEGSWSTKVGSVHSLHLLPKILDFHTAVSGTWRAPSKKKVALPKNPDQQLANLNDPNQIEVVNKQLGPEFYSEAGVSLGLWPGVINFSPAYFLTMKGEDHYSGNKGLDYGRLSKNTDTYSHGIELELEFSAVNLYLQGKSPIPGKIALVFNRPLYAENSIIAPYGRLDAFLFF
jgi:hypothetical protein